MTLKQVESELRLSVLLINVQLDEAGTGWVAVLGGL